MSDTFRIKPLVWEEKHEDLVANSAVGEFRIFVSYRDKVILEIAVRIDGWFRNTREDCASIEDGKARAEAYYRERLRAALEPA